MLESVQKRKEKHQGKLQAPRKKPGEESVRRTIEDVTSYDKINHYSRAFPLRRFIEKIGRELCPYDVALHGFESRSGIDGLGPQVFPARISRFAFGRSSCKARKKPDRLRLKNILIFRKVTNLTKTSTNLHLGDVTKPSTVLCGLKAAFLYLLLRKIRFLFRRPLCPF